jgi:molybdopterin-guanine dinucleotide biosynthesis protein A
MSHGKIHRVELGNFSRNEVALIGTTCQNIEQVFNELSDILSISKLVYVDGNHQENKKESASNLVIGGEDCILKTNRNWSKFESAFALNEFDLAVINGNHFQANNQIVFCDESKRGSLERRVSELTNVMAIVALDKNDDLPEYIKTLVPNFSSLPIIRSSAELALWIQKIFLNSPILEGLVLAGGRSVRMGEDKSQIEYHGIPQWQYLSMSLEDLGMQVNVSCRAEQQELFSRKGMNLVLDKVMDFGPMGGLISAFMNDSSKAYLTVASDLPNVNSAFLFELISQRDPSAFATAFINSEKGWPEPLITIWEPRSFLRIMQFVGVGITCPRKVLMNSPIKLIEPSDQRFLLNVNNPDERDKVLFAK